MHETVASLARRQRGLISRRQGRSLGVSADAMRRRVASGRWCQVLRGVYLVNGALYDWEARVLAACLCSGGVASHRTAAALLGVDGFPRDRIEVSVARGSAGSRVELPGVTVHWSTDLHLAGVVSADSVPTTDAARLVVDLGAVTSFERYERAVDDLVGRRSLDWDRAVAALVVHARRGRNGVGPLRALLDERAGSVVPGSALERAFVRLLSVRGLPAPETEYEVFDDRGFVARVDAAYPAERLAIELDGFRWHARRPTFEADHRKRVRLQTAGWHVIAFTWRMVLDDPDAVVRAVRTGLRSHGGSTGRAVGG